jgi:hypothetical protein
MFQTINLSPLTTEVVFTAAGDNSRQEAKTLNGLLCDWPCICIFKEDMHYFTLQIIKLYFSGYFLNRTLSIYVLILYCTLTKI